MSSGLFGSGCNTLRVHAASVAEWIRTRHHPPVAVALIAAGERWPDGTLRPAIEDLWGAGAEISHLASADISPDAHLARLGYEAIRGTELDALMSCASGREPAAKGYGSDVAIAAETNGSAILPRLVDGSFTPTTPGLTAEIDRSRRPRLAESACRCIARGLKTVAVRRAHSYQAPSTTLGASSGVGSAHVVGC